MDKNLTMKWMPHNFEKRYSFLEKKQKILTEIRAYFENQGFVAVDTPILQICPGIEPHLKAFETRLDIPHLDISEPYYLHTSPEFAMKKLLVAGLTKIYQICHCFRNEAYGPLHRPEFLMIEWYRVGEELDAIQKDCQVFIQKCAKKIGKKYLGHCEISGEWDQITVYEAFEKYAEIDISPAFQDPHKPSLELFRIFAKKVNLSISNDDLWDDLFFKIFMEKIEPKLGIKRPVFLMDYPIAMAALARQNPKKLECCERFELYINGIELANAFGELTDPVEQEKRFRSDLALKKELYGDIYPIDQDFLEALKFGLPESSGIALGVDRLVMLLTEAQHINDVNFL